MYKARPTFITIFYIPKLHKIIGVRRNPDWKYTSIQQLRGILICWTFLKIFHFITLFNLEHLNIFGQYSKSAIDLRFLNVSACYKLLTSSVWKMPIDMPDRTENVEINWNQAKHVTSGSSQDDFEFCQVFWPAALLKTTPSSAKFFDLRFALSWSCVHRASSHFLWRRWRSYGRRLQISNLKCSGVLFWTYCSM